MALADARIEDALDDADIAITILSNDVQVAIENNGEDADLILFKADNLLEEILIKLEEFNILYSKMLYKIYSIMKFIPSK